MVTIYTHWKLINQEQIQDYSKQFVKANTNNCYVTFIDETIDIEVTESEDKYGQFFNTIIQTQGYHSDALEKLLVNTFCDILFII
jgi:hypothetical protein